MPISTKTLALAAGTLALSGSLALAQSTTTGAAMGGTSMGASTSSGTKTGEPVLRTVVRPV